MEEQKKFEQIYKTILNDLQSETIHEDINQSETYKSLEDKEGLAEQRYINLGLDEKHRETVDEYIECIEGTNIEYQQLVYRCAVRNTIRALIYFGFLHL